jgi:soluble lytic murein transglycosylase
MIVLRFRFRRPTIVLLTFFVVMLMATHVRRPVRELDSPAVSAIEFSFEQIDRQTINNLIDEHRGDADVEWRAHVTDVIYEEAMAEGIDPLLVAAIVARESSFRVSVVSHAGAVGLMQLRPFVARELARENQLEWEGREALHQAQLNVRLGTTYYSKLVQRFEGDAMLALAAYHRGPTRLRRQLARGTFSGSRYAQDVLGLYASLNARRNELL